MSAQTWVGVALLGGAGACLRFLVVTFVSSISDGNLPLGVLVVNVSGSLLLASKRKMPTTRSVGGEPRGTRPRGSLHVGGP